MNVRELQLCSVIEQEFLLHGHIPTYERVDSLMTCTRAFYERVLNDADAQKHLLNVGIDVKKLLGLDEMRPGALSVEQLKAINVLLDFNDTRSDRKKLESLGIKSHTYQAWKKDPAFQAYIRERANKLFGDNIDEVDRALLDNARSGDISSIKLIYELTGKYNPRADGQVDTKALITQILEVIMRRVKDPETIKAIAADLQLLAVGNSRTPTATFSVIDSVEPDAIGF